MGTVQTIIIHVSHQSIPSILNNVWYWCCLATALAYSPCILDRVVRLTLQERTSLSFIGHHPPHGYPLHIIPDITACEQIFQPFSSIFTYRRRSMGVASCTVRNMEVKWLCVTHLPPVSNPTSEGPEVRESSPPSVREYRTVGAAATEAVTHGEHDTQLERAHQQPCDEHEQVRWRCMLNWLGT